MRVIGNPAPGPVTRRRHVAGCVAALSMLLVASPAPAEECRKDCWIEVRSQNFIVQGDAPERELVGAAGDLEAFRGALSTIYPGLDPSHPTRIVIFKERRAFLKFLPRDEHGRPQQNVNGYFLPSPDVNFIVIARYGPDSDRRIVLHEYAHHVMRRTVRPLPLWLNEGLAEFYSTFDHDSDLAPGILGRPSGDVLAVLRESEFVPLREIVNLGSPSTLLTDARRARVYYAESWALLHYLIVGRPGARREQMAALVDALTRAVPPDDAFVYAFGTTIDDIDLQLRKYVRQEVFGGIPIDPGSAHPAGAMTAARMMDGAVAGLRGELLLRVGTLDDAAAELAGSLVADPSNVEARVAMARVVAADGRRDEGVRMLEAAALVAPGDFAAQYYLGGMLAVQRRYLEAFGCFDRAVRLREHSVSALFAFSSVALALGLDDASDEALRQSMQLEASPEAYRLRAFAALGLGRDEAAAREALRYIDAVGWREAEAQETALVAAVAYARSSRPADATAILRQITMVAPPSSWVRAVAQFMQGNLTAERLLARAKSPGERTAGHTYIGLKAELAGRRDEALWHFRWVKDQGTRQEPGYAVAIEELVRIETDGDR